MHLKKIDALGSAAQKLEANLAAAKAELHQALPAKSLLSGVEKYSQNLATSHGQMSACEGARHAQETPPPAIGKRKSKISTKDAPSKRSRPGRQEMDQGDVILADDSEVERQADEIERQRGGWRRAHTNGEEGLQNEEEMAYERFPLARASANMRWGARGLAS